MAKAKFRRKAMLLFFLLFLLTASMSAPSVSFASPAAHVSVQSKRRAKKKPKKTTTKKTTKKNTKKKTKKKNSTNFAALYGNGRPFKFKIKGKTYTGFYDAAESQKSVKLLNEFRVENGKKPLKQTRELVKASMVRGKEISVVYSHRRPNGKMCYSVSSKMRGENITGGYDVNCAKTALEDFINSPPHKENMLDSDYKTVGITVFAISEPDYPTGYAYYVAQDFGQ